MKRSCPCPDGVGAGAFKDIAVLRAIRAPRAHPVAVNIRDLGTGAMPRRDLGETRADRSEIVGDHFGHGAPPIYRQRRPLTRARRRVGAARVFMRQCLD